MAQIWSEKGIFIFDFVFYLYEHIFCFFFGFYFSFNTSSTKYTEQNQKMKRKRKPKKGRKKRRKKNVKIKNEVINIHREIERTSLRVENGKKLEYLKIKRERVKVLCVEMNLIKNETHIYWDIGFHLAIR